MSTQSHVQIENATSYFLILFQILLTICIYKFPDIFIVTEAKN